MNWNDLQPTYSFTVWVDIIFTYIIYNIVYNHLNNIMFQQNLNQS